jgi:hypothetical protein
MGPRHPFSCFTRSADAKQKDHIIRRRRGNLCRRTDSKYTERNKRDKPGYCGFNSKGGDSSACT